MGNAQGKPVVFTDEANLNHFHLLRVVGKGAFGKVRIVERKDTGLTFALKYIRKDEVVRSESVRNILRERRMLEHINHPFICNLRYSFQDFEYMYLVVDLMSGGDLRFHISRKTFTEEAIRFWVAELGCALRYIHAQGIIHRDVKPDNVLLDSEGHIHLADFNVASDFTPGKALTSKSGTLAYLAPEVYKGTGYSCGADWWSLGVLFYECIYSKRPFEGHSGLPLTDCILKASPAFPITKPEVSIVCMHAVSSFLEEDPNKRIGSISFESFTQNPFFQCIDFEALERKEIEPIFVPSSEKTNFDATYDLEELLLEEAPLEARARRQKPREQLKDTATDKEKKEESLYKQIETEFLPFDYTTAAYERLTEGGLDPSLGEGENPLTRSHTGPGRQISPEGGSSKAISILSGRKRRESRSSKSSNQGTPPFSSSQSPPPLPADHQQQIQNMKTHSQQSRSESPPAAQPQTSQPPTSDPYSTNHSQSHFQGPSKSPPPPPGLSRTSSGSPISPTLSPYQQSYSRPQRPTGTRNKSMGGGVQVTLGETGSWSELARQDGTLPADARLIAPGAKPGGMLGFLSRKKGRGQSPKPQQRGVLGKEGARVVISNG